MRMGDSVSENGAHRRTHSRWSGTPLILAATDGAPHPVFTSRGHGEAASRRQLISRE